MLSMHTTSPLRRYVLLRQRGDDAPASRWSMERIASTPRDADGAPMTERPVKRAAERG